MQEQMPNENMKVAAMDCSFVSKSGRHTYGIDNFYNGKHSKAEKGLEISTLAVVDVTYNTAYNLSTRQTPVLENPGETRVDWYLEHFRKDCRSLPLSVNYLVTDGYYSKQKFTHGIVKLGYHQIGKLRKDANVRYLYQGKQKPGPGRNKQYDGKVDFNDVSRFQQIKINDKLSIYTEVVNNITLKCNIRIVYLVKKTGKKIATALLFSTDINLSALKIYSYYKSRFQIEFLFRDVSRRKFFFKKLSPRKQFLGLNHCQARCKEALHFHFNAVMTALNLIKFEDRLQVKGESRKPISISSWKTRYFNEYLIKRISRFLGFNLSSIKSKFDYESLRNYGVINM